MASRVVIAGLHGGVILAGLALLILASLLSKEATRLTGVLA
jgi:hypothetical protein